MLIHITSACRVQGEHIEPGRVHDLPEEVIGALLNNKRGELVSKEEAAVINACADAVNKPADPPPSGDGTLPPDPTAPGNVITDPAPTQDQTGTKSKAK